ncbi:cupredoxin domain-containing protein [Herbaspirillum lusitanum]
MNKRITLAIAISAALCGALSTASAAGMAEMHKGHEMPGHQMDGMKMEHAGKADDSSIGQAGDAAKVSRTFRIVMGDDMRFTPSTIKVRQGETVRFDIINQGKLKHEMVLGTPQELKAHYAAMLKYPDMEHADDNQLTLAGGKQGELIWQFSRDGVIDFACLQPGHYDAGMKGSVSVTAAPAHRH